ncbi:MAG: 4-hydroxythreonine-4-phosphate dehydrogenase [Acidobacteria bacterium RIFCSPLOWO2_12_FULL_67_14]|nr:MAG: 4-hydroxythreonine-4-phosphate dehydrogenase [Acidobacteria bacterium RIFCSPLOWO2_02_FULL_67_21]OFW34735.1 MAG: 4-hydroxythreonine-4-phosphate dehydrogenase [Acidobacteria bacterium RIFCSPLOWO2_12_FULL_67_14]
MLGDPTGIGPEISARVLASGAVGDSARVIVVGDRRVLDLGMRDAGVRVNVPDMIDLANLDPASIARGAVSAESGRACGETLEHMVGLSVAGRLDAICFAPLNKAALHAGGWRFPDEHQMFAALTGHVGFFGEMNVIPEFATFRVTSHVSLREALDLITPERIESAVRLADATLRRMGHERPRIGVAALNPHCGEGGLFGDEEIRVIRPTVERLRASGLDASGPLSSDTIFLRARRGEFDAVVMMYHDQGQIATKLLGFNKGVTVTAGLPTVFTTPAHGTAFDIVGRGTADAGGLEAALRLAARLAGARAV